VCPDTGEKVVNPRCHVNPVNNINKYFHLTRLRYNTLDYVSLSSSTNIRVIALLLNAGNGCPLKKKE